MKVFEAIMLICFGAAWPLNIYKSVTSHSTQGKSVFFLYVVLLGYISGIINKLLYSRDIVMYLYFINFFMVATDVVLFYKNKKIEEKNKMKVEA